MKRIPTLTLVFMLAAGGHALAQDKSADKINGAYTVLSLEKAK